MKLNPDYDKGYAAGKAVGYWQGRTAAFREIAAGRLVEAEIALRQAETEARWAAEAEDEIKP